MGDLCEQNIISMHACAPTYIKYIKKNCSYGIAGNRSKVSYTGNFLRLKIEIVRF